jgi:hypothetical protein
VAGPVGDLRLVQHVRRHDGREGIEMWCEPVHERLSKSAKHPWNSRVRIDGSDRRSKPLNVVRRPSVVALRKAIPKIDLYRP